ncbi:DUF4129 domain-containing protein [Chloroflexota bacterium]
MGKIILSLLLCVAILGMIPHPVVLAAEPHENNEIAEVVYNGISLFRYFSDSLDYVLQRNPTTVKDRLDKMPFANIPPDLNTAIDNFSTSGKNISVLAKDIYEGNLTLEGFVREYRIKEAVTQANWVYTQILQAKSECDLIEQAVVNSGRYFKVDSLSASIDLKTSYLEVLDKIDKIREMLIWFEEILQSSPVTAEQLSPTDSTVTDEQLSPIDSPVTDEQLSPRDLPVGYELYKETEITLAVEPLSAYVGDIIQFSGRLISDLLATKNIPLAGRQVDITINGVRYTSVTTNSSGHYNGTLQIPYLSKEGLDIQAIYLPRNSDIGIYLASLSSIVTVESLFYKATLKITPDYRIYPFLENKISGVFDYGQSPIPQNRFIQIYFDDIFIFATEVQQTFNLTFTIPNPIESGRHYIEVLAPASGRYDRVFTSVVINVTMANTTLDLDIPKIALVPGSIDLTGKLYSEIGPLNGASVKYSMDKSQGSTITSEDGVFQTRIKAKWQFNFIGSQNLVIRVIPQEPWNATLVNTRRVVIVNGINCAGILIILILLGIYLPNVLGKRLSYSEKRVSTQRLKPLPESSPVYSTSSSTTLQTEDGALHGGRNNKDNGEPRSIILSLYRSIIRIIQKLAKTLLKPGQTLREFAGENDKVLGPMAGYFTEITRMVEKLLYSTYKPTEKDVIKSRQLSNNIEEESKDETT